MRGGAVFRWLRRFFGAVADTSSEPSEQPDGGTPNDEWVKSQAMKDPAFTSQLIRLEEARTTERIRWFGYVARWVVGFLAALVLAVVVMRYALRGVDLAVPRPVWMVGSLVWGVLVTAVAARLRRSPAAGVSDRSPQAGWEAGRPGGGGA